MREHPPVADWTTDFDHTDPRWTENPFPIWDDLRKSCPVAHSQRFMGVYLPTSYEAVSAIASSHEMRTQPGSRSPLGRVRRMGYWRRSGE